MSFGIVRQSLTTKSASKWFCNVYITVQELLNIEQDFFLKTKWNKK
jgi:hypothetical protein